VSYFGSLDLDRTAGLEEGEELTTDLGFPSPAMRSGTGIGRRRASCDRRRRGIRRRCSGEDGGLENVNSYLDCFLLRGKGAAGAAICSGELRPTRPRSIPCGLNQRKNVRGGTEERRGDRGEEQARGSLARSNSTGDVCR
jgi:hypothetical protein